MKVVWTFYSPCPAIQVADLCLASCTSEKRVKDISEAAAPPQTVQISGKYESDSANLPKICPSTSADPIVYAASLDSALHSSKANKGSCNSSDKILEQLCILHPCGQTKITLILVLDRHGIQSKPIQNERIL